MVLARAHLSPLAVRAHRRARHHAKVKIALQCIRIIAKRGWGLAALVTDSDACMTAATADLTLAGGAQRHEAARRPGGEMSGNCWIAGGEQEDAQKLPVGGRPRQEWMKDRCMEWRDHLGAWDLAELEDRPAQGRASLLINCLLYTSPSPRDATLSRMPSSA